MGRSRPKSITELIRQKPPALAIEAGYQHSIQQGNHAVPLMLDSRGTGINGVEVVIYGDWRESSHGR